MSGLLESHLLELVFHSTFMLYFTFLFMEFALALSKSQNPLNMIMATKQASPPPPFSWWRRLLPYLIQVLSLSLSLSLSPSVGSLGETFQIRMLQWYKLSVGGSRIAHYSQHQMNKSPLRKFIQNLNHDYL